MTLPQNPYPLPQPAPQPKRGRRIFAIAGAAASVMVLLCCGVGIAAMNSEEESSKLGAVSVPSTEPVKATATPEEPTAAATTEPVAATTEPVVAKPRVIKGRGDDVVDIPPITDLSVVVFDCRCSSNTVLKSDGPESLLVIEIGAYKGKRWINLEDGA
ncbi:hypothetical protein [Actinoplanes xinjiangensis]|uniref:hypothetical protein n=1 Tax=Actinoplanes xinjiangensis TaxID=512350 RepID=UPI003435E372